MDPHGGTDPRTASMDGSRTAHGPAFWAGTALAALLGAAIGVYLVLPLGLIIVEYVIFPLALAVAAVLASLGAGWAGNRLASDHTRTQLLRVVGVTEAVAAVLAVVFLAIAALRLVLLGPVFYLGLFCALVLALTATIATGRFRSRQSASNDGRLTVWLLVLVVVSVPAVIFLAWLAGLAGA